MTARVVVGSSWFMPGFLHHLLPSRPASMMLDIVFIAMFLTIPALAWSIGLAKKRKFAAHKTARTLLGGVLLIAVLAFEIDMRFFTKWHEIAAPSPYYETGTVTRVLIVHLCFAVPTFALWVLVTVMAYRKFPDPPTPGPHSRTHKRLGMLSGYGMALTAITGIAFYYLAFVA
ncbi:MAG: DUF420 domain-containing protein [Pirellulales bacterium]